MFNTSSRQYDFFDSIINSEIELPELHQSRYCSEVDNINAIISGDCNATPEPLSPPPHWENRIPFRLYSNKNSYFLNFQNLITFKINLKANQISFHAPHSVDNATIRHLLLDQVLPRLFAHFHNYTIFHGGSITFEKSSFAILGDSGYGKSTLAAYFSKSGHTVLTDDCLEISMIKNSLFATPSYNSLRMLPDTYNHLKFTDGNIGKEIANYSSKRRISIPSQKPDPIALKAIFLLTEPDSQNTCNSTEIHPATGTKMFSGLLQNSFSLDPGDEKWQKAHFQRIAKIASSNVPIFSLNYRNCSYPLKKQEKA